MPFTEYKPSPLGTTLTTPKSGFIPVTAESLAKMPVTTGTPLGSPTTKPGFGSEIATGFVKTAGQSAVGVASLMGKGFQKLGVPEGTFITPSEQDIAKTRAKLETKGLGQKIGGGIETVVEYLVGGLEKAGIKSAEYVGSKLATETLLSPTTQKVITKGTEYLGDASTAFTQAKLKGESNTDATIAGVATPIGGEAFKYAFKGLRAGYQGVKGLVTDTLSEKTSQFFDKKVQETVAKNFSNAFPTAKKVLGRGKDAVSKMYENASNAVSHMVENKASLGLVDEAGNPRLPVNRQETFEAVNKGLSNVYKIYTDKLTGVDSTAYYKNVTRGLQSARTELVNAMNKENNIEKRKALAGMVDQLTPANLRDTSPLGIQNLAQSLNEAGNGLFAASGKARFDAFESIKLSKKLTDILDTAVTDIKGEGYAEARKLYGSYKAIKDDVQRAAVKEMNKTGNKLFDGLSDISSNTEMLAGLLTHNPTTIIKGLSIKGAAKLQKYLTSPERAVKNMFDGVDNIYKVANKKLGQYAKTPIQEAKPQLQLPAGKGLGVAR